MPSENPKMAGSGIVACRVQSGPCPGGGTPDRPRPCNPCFYNDPGYYEDINEPHIPTAEEARGRLVRMNDGHDSNHSRDLVIATGRELVRQGAKGWYANTSIPRFDFGAPVVFTCNGRGPLFVQCPPNVMAVRIRTAAWNHQEAYLLAQHYAEQGVPIILTPLRFLASASIPPRMLDREYYAGTHIENFYWLQSASSTGSQLAAMANSLHMQWPMIGLCEGRCADCGRCEFLYEMCAKRCVQAAMEPAPQPDTLQCGPVMG